MSESPTLPKILKHTGLAYLTALMDTAEYRCTNCAMADAEHMRTALKQLVKRLKNRPVSAEKAGTS